jgi:hypothetical protein
MSAGATPFGKILRSLDGGGTPGRADTLWILGDGRYGIEVVGESNYQEALEKITGGRKPRGVNQTVTAELRLEDENPYDANAIAVLIDSSKVGYLSRSDARRFREQAGDQLESARRILCRGRVRGGWNRGPRDRGHFGVTLDIGSGA